MFIEALFLIDKTWKRQCSSSGKWRNKLSYIHRMEYYSVEPLIVKIYKILFFHNRRLLIYLKNQVKISKIQCRFWVIAPTYKELGNCHFHPYRKIKLNKMKINDFPLTSQKTGITKQTATLKSGKIGEQRES